MYYFTAEKRVHTLTPTFRNSCTIRALILENVVDSHQQQMPYFQKISARVDSCVITSLLCQLNYLWKIKNI